MANKRVVTRSSSARDLNDIQTGSKDNSYSTTKSRKRQLSTGKEKTQRSSKRRRTVATEQSKSKQKSAKNEKDTKSLAKSVRRDVMKTLQVDIQTGIEEELGQDMEKEENDTAGKLIGQDEEQDLIDDSQSYDTNTTKTTENDTSVRRKLFESQQYDESLEVEVDHADNQYEAEDEPFVLEKNVRKMPVGRLNHDIQTGEEEEVDVEDYIGKLDKDQQNHDLQSGSKLEGEETIKPRRRMEMIHQTEETGAAGIKKHSIQTGRYKKTEAHSDIEDLFPKRKTDSNMVTSRVYHDIEIDKEFPKAKTEKRNGEKGLSIRPAIETGNDRITPMTVQSGSERNDENFVVESVRLPRKYSTPSQVPSGGKSRNRVVVHSGGSRKIPTSKRHADERNGFSRADLVIQNGELKDHLSEYKQKLKAALDEIGRMKRLIVSLKVELSETNEKLTDARIETLGLKENKIIEQKQKSKELKFTRTSTGRRLYETTVDEKFHSILELVKKKLGKFASLEVLELDEEVVDGRTKYYRSWSGPRIMEVKGYATMYLNENEGYVAACPLWNTTRYLNHVPSASTVSNIIKMKTEEALECKTGKLIEETGEYNKCLEQISNDTHVQHFFNSRLSNAIGTRKKSSRNSFMFALGYTLFCTRTQPVHKMSDGERKEYDKQREEIIEKLGKRAKKENVQLDWWRTTDAKLLCYSSLEDQESIAGLDVVDNLFRNSISHNVYLQYVNHKQFPTASDSDSSIMLLARLDAWINLICTFAEDEKDARKTIHKRYIELQTKIIPIAVQQILDKCRLTMEYMEPLELTSRMEMAPTDGDRFNNRNRKNTQVVEMVCNGKYYIMMKPITFKTMISNKLGLPYDCYIGFFDDGAAIDDIQNGCLSRALSLDFFKHEVSLEGGDGEISPGH